MQGKKRYLVVALFLLIGLTTFSFASPKEELKEKKTIKGTSEKITNDKKVNNSYTDALEAVTEAEENPTLETVETARIEIQRADDATVQQREELQNRIEVVEDSIDVAALVTELETLVSVKETIPTAEVKYPTAEDEVEKMDEGEVKDNLERRLTRVSNIINDGGKPEYSGIQNNQVTKDDVTLVVTDDTEVTKTVKLNNEDVKFEEPFTKEGTYVVTLTDEAFNTEMVTFTIDKTASKKNAVNANVSGYDNKVNEQYAINGKKVTAYITLTEELREKPTFTFYANGKEIKKLKDEVVASASTNVNYPYKYTAVLEINEDLIAEDGDITYTVTDMYDVAGNQTTDITKLSVPGKVLKLDRTPIKYNKLWVKGAKYDKETRKRYATNGDRIEFYVTFKEEVEVLPTIVVNGDENLTFTMKQTKTNPLQYYTTYTVKENDGLKDGEITVEVSGYADKAGNIGEVLTNKNFNVGAQNHVIIDKKAPVNTYVAILSKAGNYKYAKNGDTIRFLVAFDEEVKLSDDFAITFNGKTKKLVRSGDKSHWEYIAEFTIPKDEETLKEGLLTFEVKGVSDKIGNAVAQALTTANHHKYNSVIYDRTAPELSVDYRNNGTLTDIVAKDANNLSFEITGPKDHSFDSGITEKRFSINWLGGGKYTVTAKDAAGNTSTVEAEVQHVINSAESFKNAFKYGGTAVLTQNMTLDTAVELAEGQKLEIDLKGFELKISNPENSSTRLIQNKGELTIKNGSLVNEKFYAYGIVDNYGTTTLNNVKVHDNGSYDGSAIKNRNGKVVILDSEFEITSVVGYKTDEKNKDVKFGNTAVWNDGEFIIKNTNIVGDSDRAYALMSNTGTVTIENVNAKGKHGGLGINGGTVTVNNMKYESDVHYGIYVANKSDANITINGGEFIGQLQGLLIYNEFDKGDVKVTVNGGKFLSKTGKEAAKVTTKHPTTGKDATHKMDLIIKGGTFVNTKLPEKYIADGYRQNAEYAVVKENAISTKAEMVDALANGGKFELATDLTLTDEPLVIKKDKEVEIDLNGRTITGRTTNASASKLITVNQGATLKLTGKGTIDFYAGKPDTNWGGEGQLPFPGYSSNTISNSGKLVVDGPTIINNTPRGGASYVIDNYPGADLTIESGNIYQNGGDQAIRAFANSGTTPISITVNGGEIKGYRAIWLHLPSESKDVAPIVNLTINDGKLISIKEDGQAIYTYSYGNAFNKVTAIFNGGEFIGDVQFGALQDGDERVGEETVKVNGGTFHNYLGRWTDDGWKDIEKPTK